MNHMITSLISSAIYRNKGDKYPKTSQKAITNTNKVYKFHKVNAILHAAQKDQYRRAIPREYTYQ